jgi:hypothetical protein
MLNQREREYTADIIQLAVTCKPLTVGPVMEVGDCLDGVTVPENAEVQLSA